MAKQRAVTRSVPSPVGGWNVRDAYASMPPEDAVILENWWPTTVDCMIRKGRVPWATGMTGNVETLIPYNAVNGTKKLFAITSTGNLYDVTSAGPVGAALVTGLTNGRWRYASFATVGGNFVQAVNGVDSMRQYDGTTWTTITGAITGVATANLININIFKRRIWYVERNTLTAWYLPVDSIAGAATAFPMGSIFSEGGYLVSMATWTMEGGIGMDDQAVFLSSEGEINVYRGTDPASPTTFAQVGLFKQGDPIGYRNSIKYLGDVYVISDNGVVPLSSSILTAQVTNKSALSDKIQPAMASAIFSAKTSHGWQMIPYPTQNMLLVNVPSSLGNYQFAMNTITGAWTKFTGWKAACWEVQGADLWHGEGGTVYKAWVTNTDAGTVINAQGLASFNNFGSMTQTKKMNMVRPVLASDGAPSFLYGINYDYDSMTQPQGVLNFSPPGGMFWGAMVWGSMVWGGSLSISKYWQFANGTGYSAALYIKAQNNGSEVHWAETNYVLERGGVL